MTEQAYDGSAARQMPIPEPTVQTQGPPPKGRGKQEPKAGRETQSPPDQPWTAAPTMVASILFVAAVVVMILVSYAQLVMVNDEVVSLRGELETLQSEETKLMSQYELAYDLQEIEEQMLSSGQMNKIQSWQTYTLELSEPDSVEYYQASDVQERIAAFARGLVTGVQEYFGLGIT